MPTGSRSWVKHYPSAALCQTAAANHQWLASLDAPVPQLRAIDDKDLVFDHVTGRHAQPADLPQLASLLGQLHLRAYIADLREARLGQPHTTRTGLAIPDFLTSRRSAVLDLLSKRAVPSAPLTAAQAERELDKATNGPACFYKDSNPRNFLITTTGTKPGCVFVDFDTLTLAPIGYDLAKLIVTLAMTYGPLPAAAIQRALDNYNNSFKDGLTDLGPVRWDELMRSVNIHHILTGPYLGHGGYRYAWTGHLRFPSP